MKCPVCNDFMLVLELDEVEIDYCPVCQGIWLDEGELELLLEDSGNKDHFLRSFRKEKRSLEKRKRCPVCRKKMNKISFSSEKNSIGVPEKVGDISEKKIIIDGCPFYHGIWLDRGELFQILRQGGIPENYEVYGLLKDMFKNKNDE